jgi:hypothetical protein
MVVLEMRVGIKHHCYRGLCYRDLWLPVMWREWFNAGDIAPYGAV